MKKDAKKPLALNRETLRVLEPSTLANPVGGNLPEYSVTSGSRVTTGTCCACS